MNRPRTYCIITYGCQMNVHDSERMAGLLEEMGMTPVPKEEADFVLFNTCCVRENAERRVLGNVRWLHHRKKEQPNLLIGVCGCMIQQPKYAQTILTELPGVDIAFGTHNIASLPDYLLQALTDHRRIHEIWPEANPVEEDLPVRRVSPWKAYLNIMHGCDNFCSYCIVPYVRGRERSRTMASILNEAEMLLNDGVQEIMLLGQNVNSYRDGDVCFADLLRRLDQLGVPRIRFMTSHPKDLSDALIDVLATGHGICRHIHLPVQSGSDTILLAMNRGYNTARYLERVNALRKANPHVGITSDLIVGFPGETEEDFAQTLALVEEARFDAAYTFIYSPREGTAAINLPNPVTLEIATDRIKKLIACQEQQTARLLNTLIGTEHMVLAEETARRDSRQISGKCGRNITCNFFGDITLLGKFVPVTITEAGHTTLKAKEQLWTPA